MTTKDFVMNCLGLYTSALELMDKLQDNFDIELTQDDVRTTIKNLSNAGAYKEMSNGLIQILYEKIISKAEQDYPDLSILNGFRFEYYCNDFCSRIYFNGEDVYNYDELCDAIEKAIANNKL